MNEFLLNHSDESLGVDHLTPIKVLQKTYHYISNQQQNVENVKQILSINFASDEIRTRCDVLKMQCIKLVFSEKTVKLTCFSSVGSCDHLADKIPAISFLLKFGKSFCILKYFL